MADFSEVPIVEVHRDNFLEVWPSMLLAIKSSSFVAIDTELSGLGNRRLINSKCVEERYKTMCDVARTRSVLSLGLSCFRLVPTSTLSKDNTEHNESQMEQEIMDDTAVMVQTFNVVILCSEDYTVEPASLKFLVDHGFDFNLQYAKGIAYTRGNDKTDTKATRTIRDLFSELVIAKKPVVYHNALIDLVFLYGNFYADLPGNMSTFMSDMSEIFTGGIYDTKYITEFHTRFPASYLEYVFRKCQRDNMGGLDLQRPCLLTSFPSYPESSHISTLSCGLQEHAATGDEYLNICSNYAAYGWCVGGTSCTKSHDLDLILDNEDRITNKKQRRQKRKRKNKPMDTDVPDKEEKSAEEKNQRMDTSQVSGEAGHELMIDSKSEETVAPLDAEKLDCDSVPSADSSVDMSTASETDKSFSSQDAAETELAKQTNGTKIYEAPKPAVFSSCAGCHRAGFDAFMAGFIFARYMCQNRTQNCSGSYTDPTDFDLEEVKNKVCLSGKDFPLLITKSSFSKTSKNHKTKMTKLLKNTT